MDFLLLLSVLYFFLPAFVANGTPVVVKNIPLLRDWNTPISATWLGKNKTYRGLILGILVAMLTAYLQYALYRAGILPSPFPLGAPDEYTNIFSRYPSNLLLLASGHPSAVLLFGFLMGAGALVGDMVESFIKRRLGIPSGAMFFPWDGIDYVLGAIVFMIPFFVPSFLGCVFLLVIGPILSGVSNTFSFLIGWKKVPY